MRSKRGGARYDVLNERSWGDLSTWDRPPAVPRRGINTAPPLRVQILKPYRDGDGLVHYTPTMREVFERLGFQWERGMWSDEIWANGWQSERDVLTRAERKALGFKP